MNASKKVGYRHVLASIIGTTRHLAPPTAPLKGHGNQREVFLKARRSWRERYFEGTPAELLFLDRLPKAHMAFVRVGRMDVIAVISPQAMACWRKNKRRWNRLSVCRSHYAWI